MKADVHLLIVDPQNDFCDPGGALAVPGADADMKRLADWVEHHGESLSSIHVSLDTHHVVDISHPAWWCSVDDGSPPPPFTRLGASGGTAVSLDDSECGTSRRYTTADPERLERTLTYLRALDRGGRYPHCIWPPHCLVGSWGHAIDPTLLEALHGWETGRMRPVRYVSKGTSVWTEHFSAVRAEVPDPDDPSTQTDAAFVGSLAGADLVFVAGEARSHCVASTVCDVAAELNAGQLERFVLLTDATSDVPGFEHLGDAFLHEMASQGMKLATTESADRWLDSAGEQVRIAEGQA